MIALLALLIAAAPDPDSVGSVDGLFLWHDIRGSADVTTLATEGRSSANSLPGLIAGGRSILGQGRLWGGWGFRVLERRLTVSAAVAGTVVGTDAYLQDEFRRSSRFDVAPLLLSVAMTLPVERLVFVPMLGVTLPTRRGFGSDPIVALQPQLRVRAAVGAFLFGASGLLNVPVATAWEQSRWDYPDRRCPTDATRCRMPVARELLRVNAALQGEFWALKDLSVGIRAELEVREENLGQFINGSGSPEGVVIMPGWSVLELHGTMFGSWAFAENFGVTTTFGHSWTRQASLQVGNTITDSWEATLSIWFRTDARLNRMWLDR